MPSASTRLLLADSNILVYAVDVGERDKSRRSRDLLRRMHADGRAITTAQILVEFYSATVRPRNNRAPLLSAADAGEWLDRWMNMLSFFPIGAGIVRDAARGASAHQMHIYDAQVWASAKAAGAIILTEDTQSSAMIEGVEYVDPFDPAFTFESVGL